MNTDVTTIRDAREIMRSNYFGRGDAAIHFEIRLTGEEIQPSPDIPYKSGVLRACSGDHVLVAVFALSIDQMRMRTRKYGVFPEIPDSQFANEPFTNEQYRKDKRDINWCLLKKTPIDRTNGKYHHHEVPTARQLVFCVVAHFLATGERLFANTPVASSSRSQAGDTVYVQFCDEICIHTGPRTSSEKLPVFLPPREAVTPTI